MQRHEAAEPILVPEVPRSGSAASDFSPQNLKAASGAPIAGMEDRIRGLGVGAVAVAPACGSATALAPSSMFMMDATTVHSEIRTVPRETTAGNFVRSDRVEFCTEASTGSLDGVKRYPPEIEAGNCEYKLQLATCSEGRLGRLSSQLKWRLAEGGGEAVYVLGVEDDGNPLGISKVQMKESLKKLRFMAASVGCEIADVSMNKGFQGVTAEVRVRRQQVAEIPVEAQVLFLGASRVGKTTLVGVLKTDETDDGQGLARLHVLKHQHEMDQGLTSATSCHRLRFDADGEAMLESEEDQDVPSEIFTDVDDQEICKMEGVKSTVMLVDTAGHPKFFKTAVDGLTAMLPDYVMLVVDTEALQIYDDEVVCDDEAVTERIRMTVDLLTMCKLLEFPFAVIVTKVDLLDLPTEDKVASKTRLLVNKLLSCVFENEQITTVPMFGCSSISKIGIESLRDFLGTIRPKSTPGDLQSGSCMYVRKVYPRNEYDGVIVEGRVASGLIAVHDRLLFGPDPHGDFVHVLVQSIRTDYGADLRQVSAGHTVTLGLRMIPDSAASCPPSGEERDLISLGEHSNSSGTYHRLQDIARRGSCLVSEVMMPPVCWDLTLQVLACLDLTSGAVTLALDGAKHHQFTLRSSTVKQHVLCASVEQDQLAIKFIDRPEAIPLYERIILQRGSTVIIARLCQA